MIRVNGIERVRVNPIVEIPATAEPLKPIRCSSWAISSMAPAQNLSTPAAAFRPQLEPPASHYMLRIIKFYTELEKTAQLEAEICDKETKTALNRLLEIDKQKVEMIQQRAKEMVSKQSWSVFETVAQYFTSSSSIVIGMAVSGIAPAAAGFLIAAGGLGLLNRVVSDSCGWEWLVSFFTASCDLQIKIAAQIDSFCLYLSTALAIVGSIGAYQAGVLNLLIQSGRDNAAQKTIQTLSTAGSVMQISTRFGIARMDKTITDIGAELKRQQANSVCVRQEIQTSTANLRKIIDLSEKIADGIKHVIASSPT